MDSERKPRLYEAVIDDLVAACHDGQGQIAARRVRQGVWNPMIDAYSDPNQHAINVMLARLPVADREALARMLCSQFQAGVFETLKVLESFQVSPFEDGYEGSPFHDFIGRLSGEWDWPGGTDG